MFRPPARLFPQWDLQGLIEMVEDLGLDFLLKGQSWLRQPRNVDERLFAHAAALALKMSRNQAQPLERFVLTPPASPVRSPAVDLDPTSTSRFLSPAQKVEYMRGMLLNSMHPSLHQEFLAYSTPQQMLDVLEEEYQYRLKQAIPAMKAQLLALVMHPGEDMRVYMMRGRDLCLRLAEAGCVSSEHEDVMSMLRGVREYKYQLALAQLAGVELQFWPTLELFTKNTNWMGHFSNSTPSKQPFPGMYAPADAAQVPPGSFGQGRGRGRGSSHGRGRGSGAGRQGGALCSFCNLAGHSVETCWRKTPSLNPRYKAPGGSAPAPIPAHLILPATLTQKQVAALMATVEGYYKQK
jgi:hypothetical protein